MFRHFPKFSAKTWKKYEMATTLGVSEKTPHAPSSCCYGRIYYIYLFIYLYALELLCINQHTKFEVLSFTNPKILTGEWGQN